MKYGVLTSSTLGHLIYQGFELLKSMYYYVEFIGTDIFCYGIESVFYLGPYGYDDFFSLLGEVEVDYPFVSGTSASGQILHFLQPFAHCRDVSLV